MRTDLRRAFTGASLELAGQHPGVLGDIRDPGLLSQITPGVSLLPIRPPSRSVRKVRKWGLLLFCALAAILLATFLAGPVQKSFAASTTSACLTAPATQKPLACNGKDPIAENCVADAHTVDRAFVNDGKRVIGRLELRYSQQCGSYWGRLFGYLPKSYLYLQVVDLGIGPVGSINGTFVEVWSNMFYFYRPTLAGYILAENQQFDVHLNPPPGQ